MQIMESNSKRSSFSGSEPSVRIKPTDAEGARRLMGLNLFGIREWTRFYPSIRFSEGELEEFHKFPWNEQLLQSHSPFDKRKRVSESHFAFFSPAHFGQQRNPTLDAFNDLQKETFAIYQNGIHGIHEESVGSIRANVSQERLRHVSRVHVRTQPSTIMESECRPGWHLIPIPIPVYAIPSMIFQESVRNRLIKCLPPGYTTASNVETVMALHLFNNLVLENTAWSLRCLVLHNQRGRLPCLLSVDMDVLYFRIEEWNERIEEREFAFGKEDFMELALSREPMDYEL